MHLLIDCTTHCFCAVILRVALEIVEIFVFPTRKSCVDSFDCEIRLGNTLCNHKETRMRQQLMCKVCKAKEKVGEENAKEKIEEVGNTGTEPGAVGVFVTRDCATVRFPPRVQKQPYVPTRLLRSSNNAKKAQAHTVIGFWAVLQSYLSYGVPPVDYEYVVTMG